MNRGSKLGLPALGALIAVAVAAPSASGQMVVGEYRSSVDVNWEVLDRLGPEPTLPALITHPPQAAAAPAAAPRPVARPAAPPRATVFRPYAEEVAPKAAARPKAEKVVAAPRIETPKAEIPRVEPVGVPQPVKVAAAEAPKVAAAEAPKVAAAPVGKPPRPDIPVDVAPAAPKVEPVKIPEAPKAPEAPEPVKVAEAPKAPEPPKVEAPPAGQFAKALPSAPAASPPPVVQAPSVPVPMVQAPPLPAAPPPAVVAAPEPPRQIAVAVPSSAPAATRKGDTLTVPFAVESSHLPEAVRTELDRLAQRMDRDENLNLQLLAYASGDEANASKARRLSLSRALEVRKYLMEMGVRSTRIEVRALGNKVESGAADRVDAVLTAR